MMGGFKSWVLFGTKLAVYMVLGMALLCPLHGVRADIVAPDDHPPSGHSLPPTLSGVDDFFGPVQREGSLIRTTTPWPLDTPLDGQINLGIRQNLTMEVIENQGDNFDFIILITTFPVELAVAEFEANGLYWHIRNDVDGIGLAMMDDSGNWGSAGRLQGYIDLGRVSSDRLEAQSVSYRQLLDTAMHELMHRWSSYVRYEGPGGELRTDLLGHMDAHWHPLVHTEASVMYGHDWRQIGESEYESGPVRRRYSNLDLYLTGLIGPEEVGPVARLRNDQLDISDFPEAGQQVIANAEFIDIQSVIDAEGARQPGVVDSQKHFRAAMVLVSRPDETVPAGLLAATERLRRDIQSRFSAMTHGQAVLHIVPESDLSAGAGMPEPLTGSTPSGDSDADIEAALDWLEQAQRDTGMWQDRNGSRWRDTAMTMDALRLLRPGSAALDPATSAIGNAQPETMEAIAWHARAQGDVALDPGLVAELIDLQNSDGGWGLTSMHGSSVEDSAGILLAFWNDLPSEVSQAALSFIANAQNPDGSWGGHPGAGAHFSTTLSALEALALPMSDHDSARNAAREWLVSLHQSNGEFRHNGEAFSSGDASRALSLLIGYGVDASVFESTQQWLAMQQGVAGDWSGSAFATARVLQVLGLLDLPNLHVMGQPSAIPEVPVTGSLVRLRGRVGNAGRQAAPANNFRWYLGDPRDGGEPISDPQPLPELPAGSSILVDQNWATGDLQGDVEVWLVVDDADEVGEWTREDNYGQLPLMLVAPPDGPDLALHPDEVVMSPATIESVPTEVRVTGTLRNLGLTMVDVAVLGLQDIGASPPVLLADAPLDVPAQGQVAFDLSFDYNGEQSGQLRLIADPEETIPDADRSNNDVELGLSVTTGIDLQVTGITAEPESALYAGHPLSITVDLANGGLAPAPSFLLEVEVRDEDDQLVDSFDAELSLDSLSDTQRGFSWQPEQPGLYSIQAQADPEGVLDDVDSTNNELEVDVEVVTAEGINLRIDPLSVASMPDPALEADALDVSVTVHSDGGDPAPAFVLGLFDDDPRSGGQLLAEVSYDGDLDPGSFAELMLHVEELPLRGEHTLWVMADINDDIVETDELDNIHSFSITALSIPDLMVRPSDLLLTPTIPVDGEPIELESRIHNAGQQEAGQVRVELFEVGPDGQSLIESKVIEQIQGESFVTLDWAWSFGVEEGVESVRVVVDPEEQIHEQSDVNNQAGLDISVADGPLFSTNRYFSPNGDGVKDDTLLVFRLEEPHAVEMLIEGQGEIVRRFDDISAQPVDRGQVRWDGRDEFGTVVVDGDYLVRLVSGTQGIASATITVDTNRSPLVRARHQGRLFQSRVEDYRQGGFGPLPIPPLPVTDPQLGPGYVVIDPFNNNLLSPVSGVYKTAVRTLEPVISDSWIQARSAQVGKPLQPVDVTDNGAGDLAVLAEGGGSYEIWATSLQDVDRVSAFDLGSSNVVHLLGFGPSGRIIVIAENGNPGFGSVKTINLATSVTENGPEIPWNWNNPSAYALLDSGVLFHDETEVVFAGYAGGLSAFDVAYDEYTQMEISASPSGLYAYVYAFGGDEDIVYAFDQNALSLHPVRSAENEFRGSEYFPNYIGDWDDSSAPGEPFDWGRLHFGVSWSPSRDVLAVVDSQASELVLHMESGQEIFDLPVSTDVEYLPEISVLYGGTPSVGGGNNIFGVGGSGYAIPLERVLSSVLRPNSFPSGVLWEGSAAELMFVVGDIVEADVTDVSSQMHTHALVPGHVRLLVFDVDRREFEIVEAGSQWPYAGQAGETIIPGSNYYGLYFPEAHPVLDGGWWSARRPQSWFVPAGPYQLEKVWPEEHGYALAEEECPDIPDLQPWEQRPCLPIPVLNIDRPVTRLQANLIGEELDLGGFATDRNLDRWRIDVAPNDGADPWRQVIGWSQSEVIDARFLRWPPDISGPVLLRLESEDKAGNRQHAFRRTILPVAPHEPVIELTGANPRLISPNGDGILDLLNIEYTALLAKPFMMRVLNMNGDEVFSQMISHLPDELGDQILSWGGQSDAGGMVPDGDYGIEFWRYTIPVSVDTVPPQVDIEGVIPPHIRKPPASDGRTDPLPGQALIRAYVSDAFSWEAVVESRPRNGAIAWAEFRYPYDPSWIKLSWEDYLQHEFRIRTEDAAGNRSLVPFAWPGDYLIMQGVVDQSDNSIPEPYHHPVVDPEHLNSSDHQSISDMLDVWVNDAEGLRIDYLDMSLDGVDELHIDTRPLDGDEWSSYEVMPGTERDGRVSLPLDQIPGATILTRLRNGNSSLVSNIFGLNLNYIGPANCYSPLNHDRYFESPEQFRPGPDQSLLFWQAFASPEFESRELVRIRAGGESRVLEPVAMGETGARAYLVPDPGPEGDIVITRAKPAGSDEIAETRVLNCADASSSPGTPQCYDESRHSGWFDSAVPDIDASSYNLVFWRPGPEEEYPVAMLNHDVPPTFDDQIEPIAHGVDGARLYALEKGVPVFVYVEAQDGESWESEFDLQCDGHRPRVNIVKVPAESCGASVGRIRVQVLPPADDSIEYSRIRTELQTAGGAVIGVVLDEEDPAILPPAGSACPENEYLANVETGLDGLAPGTYRFVTDISGVNGESWRHDESVSVYPGSPPFSVQSPADQSLLCLSQINPGIATGQQFLDNREAAVMVRMSGRPDVVGEDGSRVVRAESIIVDNYSLGQDGTGECRSDVTTPLLEVTAPFSARTIDRLSVEPVSPEEWAGQLALQFNAVDRVGGRACLSRQVRIDSRVELDATAAQPVQPWSQLSTPMLTLDGAASLREIDYAGLTHESLTARMRIYPAEVGSIGRLVPGEDPLLVRDSETLDGPTNEPQSPISFQMKWDGLLDNGPAADGFYFLLPAFSDTCRDILPSGELVEVDSTAPDIVIDAPQSGGLVEGSLLEVVGSITDKYFDSYNVSFGLGASPSTWTSVIDSGVEHEQPGTLAVFDVSGLQQPGVIRIRALDRLGNESELLVPVTFDTPPPLIQSLGVNPVLFGPTGNNQLDSTTIVYALAAQAEVTLEITDTSGQSLTDLIQNQVMGQGSHAFEWFGDDNGGQVLPDGRYRVAIEAVSTADPDHEGTAGHDVMIDTTEPDITFVYPDEEYSQGSGLAEVEVDDLNPRVLTFELAGSGGDVFDSGAIPLSGTTNRYGLTGLDDLDEGEYLLSVEAVDRAENRNEDMLAFTIDRTPPEIELTEPFNGRHLQRGESYLISGAVADDHPLRWELAVAVEADEPDWQILHESIEMPDSSELFEWYVEQPDGDYLFRLQAVDLAGNEAEIIHEIVIDGTPPTVQIDQPGIEAWMGPLLEITGTAEDTHLAVYEISMAPVSDGEVDGPWEELAVSELSVVDGQLAAVSPERPTGPHRLRLQAWDRAGNSNETSRDFNFVGVPPPPVGLTAEVQNQQDVYLAWQAPAHEVPIQGFHVYRNGQRLTDTVIDGISLVDPDLPEGTYQYVVTAVDAAGNESEPSPPVSVTIRLTAPTVLLVEPEPGERVRGMLDIVGTAHSPEHFGSYSLRVQPPSGPDELIAQSGSPVLAGTLGVWDTRGIPDEGTATLLLEAADTFGNVAQTSVSVVVDNLAPAAPTGLSAGIVDDDDVSLSWDANSEPDLLGYLLYRNGDPVTWSGPLPDDLRQLAIPDTEYLDEDVPDGQHAYRVFAIDQAGNISPASEAAQAELDLHPPGMTIVEPLSGHAFEESVRITAVAGDEDIAQVQFAYRLEGDVDWIGIGSPISQEPYRVVWEPGDLPWDTYEVRAVATDNGGLVDPAPPVIVVEYADLTPPQIPAGLSAIVEGDQVSLEWQPVADDDLDGYLVDRFGNQVNPTPVAATELVDVAPYTGTHEYRVRAVDEAGNQSDRSAPVEVLVYRPELVQAYTPTPYPETDITGYSEAGGFVAGSVINGAQSNSLPEIDVSADQVFNLAGAGLFSGENLITLRIEDAVGNLSLPAQMIVTHGLPPEPPEGLSVEVVDDALVADWNDHIDSEVIGYRLFRNGQAVPADEPAPAPVELMANRDDPARAFDGDPGTAWGDDYWHCCNRQLYLEMTFDELVLFSGADLDWQPGKHAVDFDILGWSGDVWSPLAEIRDNQSDYNEIHFPLAYRTDRLRLEIKRLLGSGPTLGLSSLDMQARPLLVDSEWQSGSLLPGWYEVEVTAVNDMGFESDPSETVEAAIGDVQPPVAVTLTAQVDGNDVALSWSENTTDDVGHYSLHRDGEEIAQVPAAGPFEHIDQGLANGVYEYTAFVVSQAGVTGPASNPVTVEVDIETPGVPVDLVVAAPASGAALDVSWARGSGPEPAVYRLNRALAAGGPYTVVAEPAATVFLDTPLDNGTTYYYTVEALDDYGNSSGATDPVDGTPRNVTAPEPPGFDYPGTGGETVVVTAGELTLIGRSRPGTLVEAYRDDAPVSTASALAEAELVHPADVDSVYEHSLSPDTRWMWVETNDGDEYIVDTLDGSGRPLPHTGTDLAVWDAGDNRLWLHESSTTVHVVNPVTGDSEPLILPLASSLFEIPAPDGDRVLLAGRETSGDPDRIYLWHRQSGTLELLEAVDIGDMNPEAAAWAPDARHFAWIGDGRLQLLDVQADTLGQYGEDLVSAPPVWAPDAVHIAVSQGPSWDSRVQVIDTGSGDVWLPPAAEGDQSLPYWSPDGARLGRVNDDRVQVMTFPAGEILVDFEFSGLGDHYVRPLVWQRPLEILIQVDDSPHLLALPGRFHMNQAAWVPGENPIHAYAMDDDGNRSVPSDELVVIMDGQELPDLAIAGQELVVEPPGGLPGESYTAAATLRNSGAETSAPTQALLILMPPGDDGEIASELLPVAPLEPGGSTLVEWALGPLDEIGIYELLLEIDPFSELVEATRDNNYAERNFVVAETGEPWLEVDLNSDLLAAGQALEGEFKVINPGSMFNGTVELEARDAQGAMVAELGEYEIMDLAGGNTWYGTVDWSPDGLFAGGYVLHARLYDEAGGPLQHVTADFQVQLDAQMTLTLAPGQGVFEVGSTADILIGIDIMQVNGVIPDARLDLTARDGDGMLLEHWERRPGTLLSGYQSTETISWELADVPVGTHDLRLELSSPALFRSAVNSLTVVEPAGAGVLTGTVTFADTPLVLGDALVAEWSVQAPADTGYDPLTLRLGLVRLATGDTLESIEVATSVVAGAGSQGEETFTRTLTHADDYAVVLEAWQDEAWQLLASRSAAGLDLLPPEIGIVSPAEDAILSTPVTLRAQIADHHSAIEEARFRIDPDGPWQTLADSGLGDYARSLSELDDGPTSITVRATDTAGNLGVSLPRRFVVDATPPVIQVSGVSEGAVLGQPVAPVIDVIDAHPDRVDIRLDDAPFESGTLIDGEGVYRLEITATDMAGNTSGLSLNFELDFTPPALEFIEPPAGAELSQGSVDVLLESEAGAVVTLTRDTYVAEQAADASGQAQFQAVPLQLGENQLIAGAQDSAGNDSDSISRTVYWISPTGVVEGSILPAAAEFAAGSPITGVMELHNPSTVDVAGVDYRLRVWQPGGDNPLSEWSGTVDLPAGTTSDFDWSFLSLGWPLGELDLILEIFEDGEWVQRDSQSIILADVLPPDLELVAPAAGQVVGEVFTMLADATDAHSDVSVVEWSLDAGGWQAMSPDAGGPDRYAAELTGMTEGVRSLSLRARDDWDNLVESGPVNFTVDSTPPQISFEGVSDGLVTNHPVVPVIQVEDLHAVDTQAWLNGEPFASGTEVSGEGVHELTVQATDIAGNESVTGLTFEIDLTAPGIAYTYPADGAVIANDRIPLVGVTEPGAVVHLAGPLGKVSTKADAAGVFRLPEWSLRPYSNTVSGYAVDVAGNEGGAALLEVSRHTLPDLTLGADLALMPPVVYPGQELQFRLVLDNPGGSDIVALPSRARIRDVSRAGSPLLFGEDWLLDLPSAQDSTLIHAPDTAGWSPGAIAGSFEIQWVDDNGDTTWMIRKAVLGSVEEATGILFADGFETPAGPSGETDAAGGAGER